MDPLRDVRLALAAARGAGLDFDAAWAEAVEVAPWSWRDTLEATKRAWSDAYHRQGPHELADIVELRRAAREHDGERPTRGVRLVA